MPTAQLAPATSARFQSLHMGPSAKTKAFVPENVGNCPSPPRWPSNTSLSSISSSGSGRLDPDGDDINRAAYRAPLARSNPLDNAPRPAGPCAAHVLAVGTSLAPLLNEWGGLDARVADARTIAGGTLQVSHLYDPEQVRTALSPRETHTRAVLGDLKTSADIIRAVLDSERSAGGRAIIDACRLLSMPEVREHAQVVAALEEALRCYIKRAEGDYSGNYKAFGHRSHEECKALEACIKDSIAKIGPQQVRDRLLKDMAPAILDTMARKNPGVCAGELRGRLAELLNVQGFSAYKGLLDSATGQELLHVAELLPNLIESAEKPARPPANERDAAPPTAVRPTADPIADVARILKALQGVLPPIHIGNIGNNNGNNNGFRGKNFGNAKIEWPTMPLRSEPAFERLASREEQPVERPVVHTEQRAIVRVPVADRVDEDRHVEQATAQQAFSPPPPPPPGNPNPPAVRDHMPRLPEGLNREMFNRLLEEVRQRRDVEGFGLRRTLAPAARFVQDLSAQIDFDDYRKGNVPITQYTRTNTEHLAAINPYMKAPIRPGATVDSTFLAFGESTRNNVAGAVPLAVAPAAEEAGQASSGAGTATTLGRVKVQWDVKALRKHFGEPGLPEPAPIPERSASTSQ